MKTKDIDQQSHDLVLEKTNTAMKHTLTLNEIGDFSLFELLLKTFGHQNKKFCNFNHEI